MKTPVLKRARRDCGQTTWRRWFGASIGVAALLLAAAHLAAVPEVKTVTGGPTGGYVDGNTKSNAMFRTPMGLALGSSPEGYRVLYVADSGNNAIRKLDLDLNQTITFVTNRISNPVGVAVDSATNLYVLNRGDGYNGTVVKFNAYGNFLQTTPELLWSARLGLLVMVGLHVYSAVTLSAENKAARPVGYGEFKPVAASYASRTMLMSGLIVASFIVYHLLHYTVQIKAINLTGQDFIPLHDAKGRHDIYRMIVLGFSNVFVSAFYVMGVGLLCMHLSHGASSMVQSVGLKSRPFGACLDRLAVAGAIVLFLGFSSIPLAVLTGLLK